MKPVAASTWIIDVNEANFMAAVVQRSREVPVIIDFWAPWCGPCIALTPLLEKVVNEKKGKVILAKVNIDENQTLAGQFGIESIPYVVAFAKGQPVLDFRGAQPEANIRKFVERLLPGGADTGEDDMAVPEDPVTAEATYRQELAKDGTSQEARVGLARALLAQNKTEEIADLLEPIGSEGELGAEAERIKAQLGLRTLAAEIGTEADARRRLASNPGSAQARFELGVVLAASGQYEPALEMLLAVAEQDMKLASTKVRDAMVKIFYALGVNHPLADDYRSKLARLLY